MKSRMLLAALAIPALLVTAVWAADVDLSKITCPVSGKAINKDATVDYKGGKVYMCCKGCPKAFAKDTAKFATKANMQLVSTGQAKQEKCPISGKGTKDTTKLAVSGVDVTFCCNGCRGKVDKAKGDAQLDLVFGDKAFGKAYKVASSKKEK